MTSSCILGPSYLDAFVDTVSPYLSRHLITKMIHYNQIYLNYHRVETLHCSFGSNVNISGPLTIKIAGCYVRFLLQISFLPSDVAAYSLVKS